MVLEFIEPDWPAPPNVFALCTTRAGGHSTAPWESFNLARHVGDDDAAVEMNRALLRASLPRGARVQWLHQVHGAGVVEAASADACPEADGAWSRLPGQACAVLTADCLPVLLSDTRGSVVAAAHAGWRGLCAGVLEAVVKATRAPPGELLAWLGPAIGPGAYEVGREVRARFLARAAPEARESVDACFPPSPVRAGHFLADLYRLARLRLAGAGVARVHGGDYCTFSAPDRFYSHRREGRTGRMASLILLTGNP